jgi:acyl-ACP thioesterase
MNNHVNNSRYLEWIINEIPAERMLSGRLVAVEANFIAEVQSGEEVVVMVTEALPGPGVFTGYVKNRSDNRPSFAARFTFAEP